MKTIEDTTFDSLDHACDVTEDTNFERCRFHTRDDLSTRTGGVGLAPQIGNFVVRDSLFSWLGPDDSKYSYHIRAGYPRTPEKAVKSLHVFSSTFESIGLPSSNYDKFNRDAVCIGRGCQNVLFENCQFQGATDAIFDCDADVTIKSCSLKGAYRPIRVWDNVTVVAVDCSFEGDIVGWIGGPNARLVLMNCTNNGQPIRKDQIRFENGATEGCLEIQDLPAPQPQDPPPEKEYFLSAKGSGYYRVLEDGVEVSKHVAEREAIESALSVKRARPSAEVKYVHDYEVEVA